MRRFVRPGSFDVVVNLLTSFGYFADPEDECRTLRNCRANLRPGGVLVMDIMSKEVLARVFRPRDWRREADGRILLEERKVEGNWRWLEVCWTLLSGGQSHVRTFRLRVYAASELIDLLETVGFRDVRCFGSLGGSAYDQDAERLVILART
jgi:SAM-dependent methyltransferase